MAVSMVLILRRYIHVILYQRNADPKLFYSDKKATITFKVLIIVF